MCRAHSLVSLLVSTRSLEHYNISILFTMYVVVCTVSLYGDGYLRVPSQDARSETDILLSFRTSQPTSLLLLAAGTNDFCVVSLDDGAVRVRIDLGSGEASVMTRPGRVFNDLHWHSVRLRRIQATLTLIVDGTYISNAVTPGNFFEVCSKCEKDEAENLESGQLV